MNDNIIKQPLLPNAIQFHTRQNDGMTEVMRITRDGVWVNPYVEVDEAAKAVLDALSSQVKVLVQKAVEEEREACAIVGAAWTWRDEKGRPTVQALRQALAQPEKTNQCGESCERAKLCAACARELAQPEQEPFEYWNAVEGWVKIDEVQQHFDSVGCGTIYKTPGENRVPLYKTPPSIEAAVLAEREACAQVCETFYNHEAKDCAEAIRARGEK